MPPYEPIEAVDQFLYLGIVMYFNGNFNTTQKQGRKSMFSLKSKVNQMCLNAKTMFLFLIYWYHVALWL